MFVMLSIHSIVANCITWNSVFIEIIQEFNRSVIDCTGFYSCQLLIMLKCILFVYIIFMINTSLVVADSQVG